MADVNTKHELSAVQSKLLKMLRWFDGFCREHHLRYYAVGGTLLGAVRHGGFIPWDDDIDLALPRKDYDRLSELMYGRRFGKYLLESPKTAGDDFCYPFAKLYDTSTTLTENKRFPVKRGIYLDIFPFDGVGDNFEEGRRYYKKIQRKYYFYVTLTGGVRKGRSAAKNAAVIASRAIPRSIADPVKIRKSIDVMCSHYDFDHSSWVGNFLGAWGERELVARSIVGEPVEYPFEDFNLFGVEDYDRYLTSIYGDWRSLPPVEKRVSHHDYTSLDLERSYLDN